MNNLLCMYLAKEHWFIVVFSLSGFLFQYKFITLLPCCESSVLFQYAKAMVKSESIDMFEMNSQCCIKNFKHCFLNANNYITCW